MALDIVEYLKERDKSESHKKLQNQPFVTLSRETGCHSRIVGELLQKEILRLTGKKWHIVSKETILDAANRLQLNMQQVKQVLDAQNKGNIEEIILAFGDGRYRSYQKVRNILKKIISEIAAEGHCIIIGRAGAIITAGLPAGTHIRLTAPLPWRIQSISNQLSITPKEAAAYIAKTDEKRLKLFRDFSGKELETAFFDLIINNQRVSDEETVEIIIHFLKQKNRL